jgi:hypothetical protein
VWASEVTHSLVALLPLGLNLISNREECDRCVSGGGEAALTQLGESHVCHLLDGVVDVPAHDGSLPWCSGVEGYLHQDLTHIQAMA